MVLPPVCGPFLSVCGPSLCHLYVWTLYCGLSLCVRSLPLWVVPPSACGPSPCVWSPSLCGWSLPLRVVLPPVCGPPPSVGDPSLTGWSRTLRGWALPLRVVLSPVCGPPPSLGGPFLSVCGPPSLSVWSLPLCGWSRTLSALPGPGQSHRCPLPAPSRPHLAERSEEGSPQARHRGDPDGKGQPPFDPTGSPSRHFYLGPFAT